MGRKSNRIKREKRAAQKRLEEMERLEALAIEEELNILKEAEELIADICKDKGLFCGVILSPRDLGNVVELAAQSNESVKIPFRLYFEDKEENLKIEEDGTV